MIRNRIFIVAIELTCLCVLSSAFVRADEWPQIYQGCSRDNVVEDMLVDDNSNVIVTGGSWRSNASKVDCCTICYSSSGKRQWADIYSGLNEFLPQADIEKIKAWYRSFHHSEHHWLYDTGTALATDAAGNVYMAGTGDGVMRQGKSPTVAILIKYDANGKRQWVQRYCCNGGVFRGSANVITNVAAVDSKGNSFITFSAVTSLGKNRFVYTLAVLRYDTSGKLKWMRSVECNDFPASAVIDLQGNLVLACERPYGGDMPSDLCYPRFPTTPSCWVIRRISPEGKILETHKMDIRTPVFRGKMTLDADGNLYCRTVGEDLIAVLSKYSPDGRLLWNTDSVLSSKGLLGDSKIAFLEDPLYVDRDKHLYECHIRYGPTLHLAVYGEDGKLIDNIQRPLLPDQMKLDKFSFFPTVIRTDSRGNVFIGGDNRKNSGGGNDWLLLRIDKPTRK